MQSEADETLFFSLSPCSHVLFVHWGDSGISCFARPCCVILLLHCQLLLYLYPHIVKNSMWGTAGLLCISHTKARTAINKQTGINQSSRVGRGITYSPVAPHPLSQAFPVSAAVTWLPQDLYHQPHYTSVVFLHIRGALSQVVLGHLTVLFNLNHLFLFLWKQTKKLL